MNFIHILIVKKTIFSFSMVIVIILLHSRTVFLMENLSAFVEFAVQINFFMHFLKILRIISGYLHSADKFLNCLFISTVAVWLSTIRQFNTPPLFINLERRSESILPLNQKLKSKLLSVHPSTVFRWPPNVSNLLVRSYLRQAATSHFFSDVLDGNYECGKRARCNFTHSTTMLLANGLKSEALSDALHLTLYTWLNVNVR